MISFAEMHHPKYPSVMRLHNLMIDRLHLPLFAKILAFPPTRKYPLPIRTELASGADRLFPPTFVFLLNSRDKHVTTRKPRRRTRFTSFPTHRTIFFAPRFQHTLHWCLASLFKPVNHFKIDSIGKYLQTQGNYCD